MQVQYCGWFYSAHTKILSVTVFQIRTDHLRHELHLYGRFGGQKGMYTMTAKRYERLRNSVLVFLKSETDDIVLPKGNFADVFTILSVFKEYRDRTTYVRFRCRMFRNVFNRWRHWSVFVIFSVTKKTANRTITVPPLNSVMFSINFVLNRAGAFVLTNHDNRSYAKPVCRRTVPKRGF